MKESYGYVVPDNTAPDATEELQRAADRAAHLGGVLRITGTWHLSDAVYLHENTSVRLENAQLFAAAGVPLFRNSVVRTVRERTKLGCQSGISYYGKESTLHGAIELFNVKNVVFDTLSFEGADASLVLMYASGVDARHLTFRGTVSCIQCNIGTRNCFFTDIRAQGAKTLFRFASERLPNARRVNYAGPDVRNIIVRDAVGAENVTVGAYCRDILITG